MNVLILTPDAVGGTLLERLITIYMQFNEFDRPVIDVSHIELGLETYWCPSFNQKILRGMHDGDFRRMQNLGEVQNLLQSVNHYKVIKMPFYNMAFRQDPVQDQTPFFRYLNQNYFVISCRRNNVFEHALSWSLNKITKSLNVYSTDEKIKTFAAIYHTGIELDPLSVIQSCDDYRRYIDWCDRFFQVSSYYVYEQHMPAIERYVLSLPIFSGRKNKITWEQKFGHDFNTWNSCHHRLSDIGALCLNGKIPMPIPFEKQSTQQSDLLQRRQNHWQQFQQAYQTVADSTWPRLESPGDWHHMPEHIKRECLETHDIGFHIHEVFIIDRRLRSGNTDPMIMGTVSETSLDKVKHAISKMHQNFLDQHFERYNLAHQCIDNMVDLGILPERGIPIKKQTLTEKKHIIKNFAACLEAYNDWASKYPQFPSYTDQESIDRECQQQNSHWYGTGELELQNYIGPEPLP